MKTTKKSLLACGVSVLACVAMLAGTTFAWFTDTVSNKGNRIQAGTLDVELYKYGGDGAPEGEGLGAPWTNITKQNNTPESRIFNLDNLQPGESRTVYLAVKNAGLLDLKYSMDLTVYTDTLSDALLISTGSAHTMTGALSGLEAAESVTLASVKNADGHITAAPGGKLLAGDTDNVDYIALEISMMESAGNTYQGGEFTADVLITATQNNADAHIVKVGKESDLAIGDKKAPTFVLTNNVTLTGEVVFNQYCNIDFNGYTLTGDLKFDIPAGAGTIDIGSSADTTGALNGKLTVNAPGATVNHYGKVTSVSIERVADNSYHFYGVATDKIEIAQGRLVIKNTATVADVVAATGGETAPVVAMETGATVTGTLPEDVEVAIPGGGSAEVPDGAVRIYNLASFRAAMAALNDGQTLCLANSLELSGNHRLDKAVTLTAVPGVVITATNTYDLFTLSGGAVVDGVTFRKTDSANQDIINMGTGSTVKNCTFEGRFTLGSSQVTRAATVAPGASNVTFANNTVKKMRQPAYINNGASGSITGNTVEGTKGFVVCSDSSFSLSDNRFSGNEVDIAIIASNTAADNYADVAALSAANNGALVQNQVKGTWAAAGAVRTPVKVTEFKAEGGPAVMKTSGGYAFGYQFTISGDLELSNKKCDIVSYYEYENASGQKIFSRGKSWAYICSMKEVDGNWTSNYDHIGYGAFSGADKSLMTAGERYSFAATGNTMSRLSAITNSRPETCKVRLVIEITDEFGVKSVNASPWNTYVCSYT